MYYDWEGAWMALPGNLPTGEENGCWGAQIVGGPYTAPPEDGQTFDEAMAFFAFVRDNDSLWGRCPTEEAFDLEAYANNYWRGVAQPPPPSPLRVAPGKMLVAFDAFLEIQGDPSPQWTLDSPIGGNVVVEATPRYVIDWGDGSAATHSTSRGGPFPNGDITHAYADADTYTVTVQAYWSGRWSSGAEGGDLAELAVPTASSLTLPVEERQAVTD
ncbi:MAG: hypothetical protein WKF43_01820 [Acidimicrobiales bacterium]